MDVRQLRYFSTIARCGSFSRASAELNVAQPALSHHVANLEAELGVRLFNRSTRGVVPTECGLTLIAHSETILRQMARAVREVQAQAALPSGPVEIGLPTSVSLELTVPLLKDAERRHPGILLKVNENHSGYLTEWLHAGQLDMAVLFDVEDEAAFVLTPLLTEHLVLVTAPGAAADGRDSIDLAELVGMPLVVTGKAHGLRQLLDRHAGQAGITLHFKSELDSLVAIKKLVAAGYGHAVLPWGAVQEECRRGILRAAEIRAPRLARRVYLATSQEWPLSRAAEVIADVVVELARELVVTERWRGELTP